MEGVIFCLIGAFLCFVCGTLLLIKSAIMKKNNLYYLGKVIDVYVDELPNINDVTVFVRYTAAVEFEKNGVLYKGVYYTRYEQFIGGLVDIQLLPDGTVNFVAYRDSEGNSTGTIQRGYKIIQVLGIILYVIGTVIALAQIPIVNANMGYLFAIVFAVLPIMLLVKLYKSGDKIKRDIDNGMYNVRTGRIVNVLRKGRYAYPVVEYPSQGKVAKRVLKDIEPEKEKSIGKSVVLYEHRITLEVIGETGVKHRLVHFYIALGILAIAAIFVSCAIYFGW